MPASPCLPRTQVSITNSAYTPAVASVVRTGQPSAKRSSTWLVAALWVLVAAAATAQRQVDHVLPAPIPYTFEGPAFVAGDGFALCGDGQVHVFRDLAGNLGHQVLVPTGRDAMASPWTTLSRTRALYRSVGADGIPKTPDDGLVIVADLPERPFTVPFAFYGVDAEDFIALNQDVAVLVDGAAQRCLLLNHAFNVPQLISEPTPFMMDMSDDAFQWGRVHDRAIMGMVPGPDGALRTQDDHVAVINDLDPTLFPSFHTMAMPSGFRPNGFFVTNEGVGVAWRRTGLAQMELLIVAFEGPGRSLQPVLLPINFFSVPAPGYTPTLYVEKGLEGSVLVGLTEESGPGVEWRVISDLDSVPREIGAFLNDHNCGCVHQQLGATDLAFFSGAGPYGFRYHDFATGQNFNLSFPFLNSLSFAKPTSSSLVAFGDLPGYLTATGRPEARAVVITAPGDPLVRRDRVFALDGTWAGGGIGFLSGDVTLPPVIVTDDGAAVAGFIDTDGDGQGDYLRRITVPSASFAGRGLKAGPSPVTIESTNVPPAVGTTGYLSIDAPLNYASSALVVVTFARLDDPFELGPPITTAGSLGWLDLGEQMLQVAIPIGPGAPDIPISAPPALRAAMAGRPLYLQAAVTSHLGEQVLSDCYRLVMD